MNNAAIGPLGTILDHSEELWDRVIEVNLKGLFVCCKAVLPHMLANGGGSIVNIGSGSGWGKPNMFAYAASKGGVLAFSQALAVRFLSPAHPRQHRDPGRRRHLHRHVLRTP